MENKYALAMYDIRGKQEFIYRSSRIKEIIGGSALIRDCFEGLYKLNKEKFGKGIFRNKETAFTESAFKEHLEEGYIGEVVYDGGGNFQLIFKDDETCKDVTYEFSKKLMKKVPSLRVLCTYIVGVNFSDYLGDRKKLYDLHRVREMQESNVRPYAAFPIVQLDRRTSMPLTGKNSVGEKVSAESKAKYDKYDEIRKNKPDEETILDNLVTQRDEESLLAVIYIDGNSMGAKVQTCCDGKKSYEDCVAALRQFSAQVQKNYIDDRLKEIDDFFMEKYKTAQDGGKLKRRFVVYAGDEITFICNARDAYDIMCLYLKNLPEGESSCAGAVIFQSHSPYSEAYRIAEECCENAKKVMKALELTDTSLMDFHYSQGGTGESLETIRDKELGGIISKPWIVKVSKDEEKKTENLIRIETVERVRKFLNQLGRSNVKGLAEHARYSASDLEMELMRIKAHMSESKRSQTDFDCLKLLDKNEMRKLIYDVVIMYDLWFHDVKGEQE